MKGYIEENMYHIDSSERDSHINWSIDIDDLTDGMIEKNIITDKIFISPKFKKILGYKENELSLEEFKTLIYPDDFKKLHDLYTNFTTGAPRENEIEYRIKSRDGEYKWFLLRFKLVFDNNHNPSFCIGINTDITYKKVATQKLKESEQLYKNLVELSPDAIYFEIIGQNVFSNTAGAKILGYSQADDIIASNPLNYIHPDYHDLVKSKIRQAIENKSPLIELECKLIKKDGSVIDVEARSKVVPLKNKYGTMTIVRDITERKKIENDLNLTMEKNISLLNKALEYEKIKTQFFCNISHELKTPLNVLLCAIQLMTSYTNNNQCSNSCDFSKYLNMMKQNSYRLLRLINNLIDITKIDSGFMKLNLKNHNVVKIIEDITELIPNHTKFNSISLNFHTDVEERILACDADIIERIMLNLLSNAIKCSKPNSNIWVSIYDKSDSIQISVKDDGVGIPKDKQEIIFDRFRQVNCSLNRTHEGSGIGLSLVKSLVEMHGGTISVKSEEGISTEFIIDLPIRIIEDEPLIIMEDNSDKNIKIKKVNIELSDIYS